MEQAYALDAKNDNVLWASVVSKEMENVRVAFEVLPDGRPVPTGHLLEQCHMVFNIKMEDFKQKARLLAGGHMPKAPSIFMYASIVSRETVRIALMISAIDDVEVKLGNILNAYVHGILSVSPPCWFFDHLPIFALHHLPWVENQSQDESQGQQF